MRNLHTHDKLDFDVAKQIVIFAPLTALQLHFQDGTVTHLGLNTIFFLDLLDEVLILPLQPLDLRISWKSITQYL